MQWPGTDELAAIAGRAAVGHGEGARLCSRDGRLLHTVERVSHHARVLRWRKRVFLHWAGDEWRQVDVVDVDARATGVQGE